MSRSTSTSFTESISRTFSFSKPANSEDAPNPSPTSDAELLNRLPPEVFAKLCDLDSVVIQENAAVKFLDEGGFSKIYLIQNSNSGEVVLKLCQSHLVLAQAGRRRPTGQKGGSASNSDDVDSVAQRKLLDVLSDEANKLLQFHHPFIIRYLDSFVLGQGFSKTFGILLEYCTEGTLLDKIKSGSEHFPIEAIRRWFYQLALALEYVHFKGYLHLDVRSANVFVRHNGDVTLGDFGISRRILECLRGCNTSSSSLMLVGQRNFLSPERIERSGDLDFCTEDDTGSDSEGEGNAKEAWKLSTKDDVWSYGVTLYHAVTRRLPFSPKRMSSIVRDPHRPMVHHREDLPLDLIQLVDCLLKKNPKQRPEMREVLAHPFFRSPSSDTSYAEQIATVETYKPYKLDLIGQARWIDQSIPHDRRVWLHKVSQAIDQMNSAIEMYDAVVLDSLVTAYKAAATAIQKHSIRSDKVNIITGSLSLVGVAISAAGFILTAATAGLGAPVGIPIAFAGGAIGIAGGAAGGGTSLYVRFMKKAKIKDLESAERLARKADALLIEKAANLAALFPDDQALESIRRQGTADPVESARVIGEIARGVFRAGELASDMAMIIARTAVISTTRTIACVLLPIGAVLDVATIISAGVSLKKDNDTMANELISLCNMMEIKAADSRAMLEAALVKLETEVV